MTTMTNTDEYNGWSNRETWACNLHLSNTETSYRQIRELAEEVVIDCREWKTDQISDSDMITRANWKLADAIQELVQEAFTDQLTGLNIVDDHELMLFGQDLKNMITDVGSLWRVDWVEIAEGWVHDAMEVTA